MLHEPSNVRTIVIDSRVEEVERLSTWVEAAASESPLIAAHSFKVQVCIEEAVANLILHGFRGEPGHPIEVCLTESVDELLLEIKDRGLPFDPRNVAEPELLTSIESVPIGGIGIHLMRNMTRSIDYASGEAGNNLSLVFADTRT
jgi:serine/threonine-protein kinase RsbW